MPWRVMSYKFINTFIDDLFAFVVPMPTMHRLACFRDDIIFFVFLYQRYLYPVDKTRRNEFGQSAVGAEDAQKVRVNHEKQPKRMKNNNACFVPGTWYHRHSTSLTLLGPQSRFGDKLLVF